VRGRLCGAQAIQCADPSARWVNSIARRHIQSREVHFARALASSVSPPFQISRLSHHRPKQASSRLESSLHPYWTAPPRQQGAGTWPGVVNRRARFFFWLVGFRATRACWKGLQDEDMPGLNSVFIALRPAGKLDMSLRKFSGQPNQTAGNCLPGRLKLKRLLYHDLLDADFQVRSRLQRVT